VAIFFKWFIKFSLAGIPAISFEFQGAAFCALSR
jgi:hypothetical protein